MMDKKRPLGPKMVSLRIDLATNAALEAALARYRAIIGPGCVLTKADVVRAALRSFCAAPPGASTE